MRVDVFTIFPELVEGFCSAALLGRARRSGQLDLRVHDLRSAAGDPRKSVDDAPFGGGAGMVLMPGPIFTAVEQAEPSRPLFLLGPGGRPLTQALARSLAGGEGSGAPSTRGAGFSLLCGRYEGVDQRVVDHLVDDELSVGDYVMAGGEAGALVVLEVVTRLLPGVMGNKQSADEESFVGGLLEYPQYTRPARFRDLDVPEVLRGGDHGTVAMWRRAASLRRTLDRRPDLIEGRGGLSPEEQEGLDRFPLAGAPPGGREAGVQSLDPEGPRSGPHGLS